MPQGPNICPICREQAATSENGAWRIKCDKCGEFEFSFPAAQPIQDLPEVDRQKLRCVMAERRLKGLRGLFIGTSKPAQQPAKGRTIATLDELLADYPRSPLEHFDRVLMNMTRIAVHPVSSFSLDEENGPELFSPGDHWGMIEQMIDMGYIKVPEGARGYYRITAKGWERADKLRTPGAESIRAFVAMWFDQSRADTFEKAIKPAIEADSRTKAMRIDLKEHNGKIDDEIIAEIRASRYMVADFTGHRGGVYFEAGFAQGLGLPVIWIVQKDDLKNLHFDTRQYNFIDYVDFADLYARLLARIRATAV